MADIKDDETAKQTPETPEPTGFRKLWSDFIAALAALFKGSSEEKPKQETSEPSEPEGQQNSESTSESEPLLPPQLKHSDAQANLNLGVGLHKGDEKHITKTSFTPLERQKSAADLLASQAQAQQTHHAHHHVRGHRGDAKYATEKQATIAHPSTPILERLKAAVHNLAEHHEVHHKPDEKQHTHATAITHGLHTQIEKDAQEAQLEPEPKPESVVETPKVPKHK